MEDRGRRTVEEIKNKEKQEEENKLYQELAEIETWEKEIIKEKPKEIIKVDSIEKWKAEIN